MMSNEASKQYEEKIFAYLFDKDALYTKMENFARNLAKKQGHEFHSAKFTCIETMILKEGLYFMGQRMDCPIEKDSNVYENARKHFTTDYIYIEGIAMRENYQTPVLHAWLVNKKTGAIFDPTWGNEGLAYAGVAFSKPFVDHTINDWQSNAIFDEESDNTTHMLFAGLSSDAFYKRAIPETVECTLLAMAHLG